MSQETLISQLKEKFPEAFLDITEFVGEKILHLKSQNILLVLTALKSAGYNFLADLTAIDNLTLGGFERFAVSYHLLCHETAERVTVKAYVSEEKPTLPSVESLWKTADWQEREVFDLYGINNIQPIWADSFLKSISNAKMGVNLSRGDPTKYYSSDRIIFEEHPDLTRIMNPDDYEGYPLRKDYPRLGRKERDDFPVVDRGIQKKKPLE